MKRKLLWIFITSLIVAAGISCSKSNENPGPSISPVIDSAANIISFKIVGMNPTITIAPPFVNIRFPDTILSAKDLVASFTLSPGAKASIFNVNQVSEVTKNNFESFLNYSVKSAGGFTKYWIVTSTNNDNSVNWCLGNFLKRSLCNDRSYNWYFSQAGTGPYSGINCGPTSVTMAMKWADSTFSLLPEDARNYFPGNTYLWGPKSVEGYLTDHAFDNKEVLLGDSAETTKEILKKQLDQGNIVILCLSMAPIRPYMGVCADPRVDRYYPESFNHFIVTYGYTEVDNEFYFQVNDPWNFGWVNNDGSPKGKGRFYRYEDIFTGCLNNGNVAVVVYKK